MMMRFILIISECCWLFSLVIQTPMVLSYRYDYTAIMAKYNRDDIPLWRQKACEKAQRMKSSSHYVCDELGNVRCLSGWQGDLCQVPMCRRGCDPMNGYCERPGECRCRLGFTGELCQKCIALPGCQYGDCTKPFECICRPGWKGLFCTEPTCRPGCHAGRGYCETPGECRCRLGWSGRNCSECAVMPGCQFGTCSKPLECKCLPGYTGLLCSTPTCAVNCHKQHGYCRRPNECRCRIGWTGENCAKCFPYPGCVNGNCEKPWECNCLPGWGGLLCNEKLSYCLENPNVCSNNGTCIPFIKSEGSYRCECRLGYFGRNCQHIDEFLLTSVAPPRITPPALPSTTPTWLLSLNGTTSVVKRNDSYLTNITITDDDDDDDDDADAGVDEEDEYEEEDADGDEEEDADTDEDNVNNRDDESGNAADEHWTNSSKPFIGKSNSSIELIDKTTTATTMIENGNTSVTAFATIATLFNNTATTTITTASKKASAMAIPLHTSGLIEMANSEMNHISAKDNYKNTYSLASVPITNRTTTTPITIVTPLMQDHILETKTKSKTTTTTTTTARTNTKNEATEWSIKDEKQQQQVENNISQPISHSKTIPIIQAQGDFAKATVTAITIKANSSKGSSADNRHKFHNQFENSIDNNKNIIIDQVNYQTIAHIITNTSAPTAKKQTNILGQKEEMLMGSLAIQKIPSKGSQDIESESKLLEIPLDDLNFKQQNKLLKQKKVGENQIETNDDDDDDDDSDSDDDDDDDDEDDEDYDDNDDVDSDINYYLYDDDDDDDDDNN